MNAWNCYDCHELEQELKIAKIMAETAYQRGRTDAANAVNEFYTVKIVDDGFADTLEAIIVAARGSRE